MIRARFAPVKIFFLFYHQKILQYQVKNSKFGSAGDVHCALLNRCQALPE